jgi:hypothetical protein
VTSEGHPRSVFRRAIARKNLMAAEAAAREMGIVSTEEAMELTLLVGERAPERLDRYGRRLLVRLVEERPLSLAQLDLLVAALRTLPSAEARATLRSFL